MTSLAEIDALLKKEKEQSRIIAQSKQITRYNSSLNFNHQPVEDKKDDHYTKPNKYQFHSRLYPRSRSRSRSPVAQSYRTDYRDRGHDYDRWQ